MPELREVSTATPLKITTCGPSKIGCLEYDVFADQDPMLHGFFEASSIPSVLSHLRSQPINDIDGMLLSKADLLDRGVGGSLLTGGGRLILLFSVVWGEEVKGGGLLLYGGGVIVDVGEEWGGGVIVVMGGCFSFGGTVQYIEESNIYLCFVVCRLKRGLVT